MMVTSPGTWPAKHTHSMLGPLLSKTMLFDAYCHAQCSERQVSWQGKCQHHKKLTTMRARRPVPLRSHWRPADRLQASPLPGLLRCSATPARRPCAVPAQQFSACMPSCGNTSRHLRPSAVQACVWVGGGHMRASQARAFAAAPRRHEAARAPSSSSWRQPAGSPPSHDPVTDVVPALTL